MGGGDLLSLICPELGVTPLVDLGTDVKDERPTPALSLLPLVDGVVPLSSQADVDVELFQVFPVGDPEGGFMMTPARSLIHRW